MSDASILQIPVLPSLHEAFLERAAEADATGTGQHALGAFLTMRLVDRFALDTDPPHPQALAYQLKATRDYLLDIYPQNAEITHLLDVVRVCEAVANGGTRHLLWPPLQAYAYWLEHELRLAESLDAIETTLRLQGPGPDSGTDQIATCLQQARVLRLLGRFEEAQEVYEIARVTSISSGDVHSALLGRIGQAIVKRQLGNLKASETALRDIVQDAEELEDRDAQSRAHHDLGAALTLQNRGNEALLHFFRAFELYDQVRHKMRALSDLGEALKRLGAYAAAERAFQIVLASNPTPHTRAAVVEEMLEVTSALQNRVAFERWRHELEILADQLPVQVNADFELALGVGYTVFGERARATKHLERALRLAEQNNLNELVFRAEAAFQELEESDGITRPAVASDAWSDSPEVADVAEKLQALSAC